MSAAVRCLAVVLVGWAGARAATTGASPVGELFELRPGEARSAVRASAFPPLEPAVPLDAQWPAAPVSQIGSAPIAPIQTVSVPF